MFGNDDGKQANFMGGGLSAKSMAKLEQLKKFANSSKGKEYAKKLEERRGRTTIPYVAGRPVMKINRPPTISMMFKGKTDP